LSFLPAPSRRAEGAVNDALTAVVSAAALLLAAWCGYATARDQPTKDWHLIGMAVVSVLAAAQLVVGVVDVVGGRKPAGGTPVFLPYAVGAVLVVPAAGFTSLIERTRWGSAIAVAGGLVLAALELRLASVWGGGHG
jgi:hypothetical protein